ncbi:MAG: FAD-binding oxidoreductase [Planctomycetota bacterium]
MSWAELSLRVVSKRTVCDDVVELALASAEGALLAPFEPGQYLTLSVQPPGTPQALVRCYSLCHAPDGGPYRVAVKRVTPTGAASSFVHDGLQVGDVLAAQAPRGRFTLDPGARGPLVFVAGGIGITPLKSLLEGLEAAGAEREVQLVFGVRSGREHPFRAELQALAARCPWLRLTVLYSRPAPEDALGRDYQRAGRIDLELLTEVIPPRDEPYGFYLCAPAALQTALVAGLRELGVPDAHVHVEAFGRAALAPHTRRLSQALAAAGPQPEVEFARSGVRAPWDPAAANLLDFALEREVFFPFACAVGHCGTCHTRLLEGEVAYAQTPDFQPRPGHCLPCVAVPRTDVKLDA